MLVNGVLKTISIGSAQIMAIPCQSIDELDVNPITCSTSLNDFSDIASFHIACPRGCGSSNVPLYGDNIFSADSSICKAVEFSGA